MKCWGQRGRQPQEENAPSPCMQNLNKTSKYKHNDSSFYTLSAKESGSLLSLYAPSCGLKIEIDDSNIFKIDIVSSGDITSNFTAYFNRSRSHRKIKQVVKYLKDSTQKKKKRTGAWTHLGRSG